MGSNNVCVFYSIAVIIYKCKANQIFNYVIISTNSNLGTGNRIVEKIIVDFASDNLIFSSEKVIRIHPSYFFFHRRATKSHKETNNEWIRQETRNFKLVFYVKTKCTKYFKRTRKLSEEETRKR
jgi:hypothetical protein